MRPDSATVFDSFNARPLLPEQVARTFVPPQKFNDFVARCHSTVIGPRGSGKTSLLKMLQPRALESWDTAEGHRYRSTIDYTGVFIPTDVAWSRQTSASVEGLQEEDAKKIRNAAFTTAVLHALIETLRWRVSPAPSTGPSFRRASLHSSQEANLVAALAEAWTLAPRTLTFLGLKHSLSDRNAIIWSLAQSPRDLPRFPASFPKWIALDFLACCNYAVEIFDDAIGQSDSIWALLFDELELAPEWIMEGLLIALRSRYPRFIFKLALSPYDEKFSRLQGGLDASPHQDFNEILLWHAKKEDGLEFSKRLFLNICRDQGRPVSSVEELLGLSVLDDPEAPTIEKVISKIKSYGKGSRQYETLKKAIKLDSGFASFWKNQNIDIEKLRELPEEERAAKVRKVYPLILLRTFFRTEIISKGETKTVRRARKSLDIYTGASSVLTMAEGNPRWIIGITRILLNSAEGKSLPIRKSDQATTLEETIHKFRARLKAVAFHDPLKQRVKSLLSLIDDIGHYYSKEFIDEPVFHPQPVLSFTVDANTHPDLVAAIGRAANLGAIVYVPDKGSSTLMQSVRGKRFRLSYLLAPFYRIPLRLGDSVSISRIPSVDFVPEEDTLFPMEMFKRNPNES